MAIPVKCNHSNINSLCNSNSNSSTYMDNTTHTIWQYIQDNSNCTHSTVRSNHI